MLRSSRIFALTSLPYELLASAPVWERHCAEMAAQLPPGARHVLDLGCGPGNSTAHLRDAVGPGAVGGDFAMPMLRRARRRGLALACMDAGALPVRSGSLDAVAFHSVLYLLPDRAVQLPRWRERSLRELGPLRALATVELWKGRGREYDDAFEKLKAIAHDADALKADLVICTGDLTQLAMEEEFALAREALAPL